MLGIGDFARYAGVSVRMLRHYDQIGLLAPSYVDPASGYRRYDEGLLDRVHALVALKELGFSLEEVGRLLDGSVPATEVRRLLDERRSDLRTQIETDLRRLGEVERRLRLLEGENTMELEYTEKPLPEVTLAQLTVRVAEHAEIAEHVGPMFERLADRLVEEGRRPSHPGYAWYDAAGEGIEVGVGFATDPIPGAERGDLAAAERAVTAVYRGAMSGIGEAWQQLASHVTKAGLAFAGPGREVYLQTEGPQETWVTELQQPVA